MTSGMKPGMVGIPPAKMTPLQEAEQRHSPGPSLLKRNDFQALKMTSLFLPALGACKRRVHNMTAAEKMRAEHSSLWLRVFGTSVCFPPTFSLEHESFEP